VLCVDPSAELLWDLSLSDSEEVHQVADELLVVVGRDLFED
jgi:hypothetical protein